MIATEDLSLSNPLSNILKIEEDERVIKDSNKNSKQMESEKLSDSPRRIQVPHSSSEFLTAWVDKLQANALTSLYILPFRELNSNDFIKLFNAIANCTSLNILTISGHDFGLECHSALTKALSNNASIITLEIGSSVLGLCSEEIETITASNSTTNNSTNNSEINESGNSTPTMKKESNLSALLNSTASSSTEIINTNSNSNNDYLNHCNSDMTLVPPSPPSYSDSNSYNKQYSTSTPNFIHQVSSALSRNLKSYTQTQNYLNNSKGVFNQHKMNIAKNHPYLNQNPTLPSTDEGEKNVNEPDNLESFKAICTGIGMNQSIQHWNLDYKSIGFRASEILADRVLLCNKTLVKLSLARNHLGDKGCIAICQALIKAKNTTLRYLNLKDNDIGSEGMGEKGISGLLKACFHDETVEDINSGTFDFNPVTPSSSYSSHPKFLAMTPLTSNKPKSEKNVTISDAVEVEVTTPYLNIDTASSYESHHHGHRHSNSGSGLLSTSCSSTISNSSSCSIYASSHTHCGIRELNLSCNPIGDEGGVLIGEALKYNTSVRELDLSNTDIGDDTMISICKNIESTLPPNTINEDPTESPPRCSRVQHSSRLLKLSVTKNHIGPKACEAIGKLLEKNPRICSLSLNGNCIGDEGVKYLARPFMINKSNSLYNNNGNGNGNSNSKRNSLIVQSTSPTSPKMMGIPINKKDHHYGSNMSSCSSYNSVNGWTVPGMTTKSPASAGSNGNSWSVFGVHSLSFSNDGNKSPTDTDWNKYSSTGHSLSVSDVTGSYLESNVMNFNSSNSNNHCKNTHLNSLYLSANNITMKGFIDLIQSFPALKLLDLHKNNICLTEKDDFSTVIKKFGLNKLQELYLSDNSMSVTDLKLICNMLHSGLSPKLEELGLTGNVSLYDDEAYEEWEERITQLEIERPCLSITWR